MICCAELRKDDFRWTQKHVESREVAVAVQVVDGKMRSRDDGRMKERDAKETSEEDDERT